MPPANADAVLLIAAGLTAAGRIADAAAALSAALRIDAGAHVVRYQLGLAEAQLGNLKEAEELARGAAAVGGDCYARGLGHILAKVGKLEEAEAWLGRALQLNTNDAWAHASLGAVYGDQRRLDAALICMDAALLVQPDFPWARASRERLAGEIDFLGTVRAALLAFSRDRGLDPAFDSTGPTEIEFPSASVDASGEPRFQLRIPTSLVLNDLGAAHLFYREVVERGYEFGLREFLDRQLRSDDVFIDVGAHWGLHSLTAATRWPRQVSVMAIEAHPENAARLRRLVAHNSVVDEVEVISTAIGDRVGVTCLQENTSSMGHCLGSRGIPVDITTLDALLAGREWLRWRRILLKVDVEGFELEALTGARQMLASCDVAAVIWEKGELGDRSSDKKRADATYDLLSSFGFEHFVVSEVDVGGALSPVLGGEGACNIYSLSRTLVSQHRFA